MKHGVQSIYQINFIVAFGDSNCLLFGRCMQQPQIFQQPCFRNSSGKVCIAVWTKASERTSNSVWTKTSESVLISVKDNFAVILPWSCNALPIVTVQRRLLAMRLSHHNVVCCCFSSERTHHWLWFPKVTEGYPPAPWWPRTLAKGQHKVYCFIKYGKAGYCMFLSESARLQMEGPGLVPNPDELKQRHDR